MFVEDPEVTLVEEGHGFPEGARDTAMCMWNCVATAHGDDGKQYWINMTLSQNKNLGAFTSVPMGAMDLGSMGVSWEIGKVVQSPSTIYKIADFPQSTAITFAVEPSGELTIKRSKNEVSIDMGDYHVICKDDKTWHFNVNERYTGIKAEWVHHGVGYPTWYGKDKPAYFAPNSIVYGYSWSGAIEGTLTIEGRKVGIKGAGVRERHYAIGESAQEEGAWMEWLWFHFDEVFGSLDELKASGNKEVSIYLVDEKQYFQAGNFNIEHHNWAWLQPLGAFIPTRHRVTIETEAGVLEMTANAVGCTLWGCTGEVPDCPISNLHWDKVEGTFTYKDGRKKTLTNGLGGSLCRQWKPYPSIITSELIVGGDQSRVVHMPTAD